MRWLGLAKSHPNSVRVAGSIDALTGVRPVGWGEGGMAGDRGVCLGHNGKGPNWAPSHLHPLLVSILP